MKRILALMITAMLLLCCAGCGFSSARMLRIEGDCEETIISTPLGKSILLQKAIALSKPHAAAYDVLLIGADGLTARISGADLKNTRLFYSYDYAWELRDDTLPPSAHIKNIAKLALVSASDDPHAVRLINGDKVQSLTPGQLLLEKTQRSYKTEGTSQLKDKSVTVYTTQWRIPLSETELPDGQLCAVSNSGKTVFFCGTENAFLQLSNNKINLILPEGEALEDVAGIIANPPQFLITETASDALRLLEQGERVMVIELDGWGYAMHEKAGAVYAPYLTSLNPEPALACYAPVSAVGLAAMLTGETPDINGVHNRDNREIKGEHLFAKAKAMGKSYAYIEGSHMVLNLDVTPALSLDDKDTFENAKKALAKPSDLTLVHFHGIDDSAHRSGPYAQTTLEKIKEIDGYVQDLMRGFDGSVIITADHGLHATSDGGTHGQFCLEDMVVPYIIRSLK